MEYEYNPLFNVEHSLHVARVLMDSTFEDMRKKKGVGLSPLTIYNIENHKGYYVDSLLKFAAFVDKTIYINNRSVTSLQDIGDIFRDLREKCQLTLLDIYEKTKIYPYIVSKIERGKRYNKATLIKYLSFFPIEITID